MSCSAWSSALIAAARAGSAASAIFIFASKALAISGVIFTGAGARNICTHSPAASGLQAVISQPFCGAQARYHPRYQPPGGGGGVCQTVLCTSMVSRIVMVLTITKPKSQSPAIDAACGCLLSLLSAAMRLPGPNEGDRATELLMACNAEATVQTDVALLFLEALLHRLDSSLPQFRHFAFHYDRLVPCYDTTTRFAILARRVAIGVDGEPPRASQETQHPK